MHVSVLLGIIRGHCSFFKIPIQQNASFCITAATLNKELVLEVPENVVKDSAKAVIYVIGG